MLRYIRIIAAAAVLLLSLLLFLDFAELIPRGLSDLMRMQFIPAVMDRRWLAIILLLVSVLLFGRIYCSVLCPFGILQDVVIRVKRFFAWIVRAGKKKKNPKKQYRKPYN